MAKTIDDFRCAIKKHKSVILQYPPSGQCYPYVQLRYDMDEKGNVRELYNYNRTVYFVSHIDDAPRLSERIGCQTLINIIPTPAEMVKKFNYLKSDE